MHLLALSLSLGSAAPAAGLSADDFRIYCGWLSEVAKDENKGLPRDKQVAKVAKVAKLAPKQLKESVARGEAAGPTCEGIAKGMEEKVTAALKAEPMGPRLDSVQVDMEDPSHVVVYLTWKVQDVRKVEEEASTAAWAVAQNASITTTLSVSAKKDDDTPVFEGVISADNARRIDKARINSMADGPYVKFFEKPKG
jgi:hypothetical protein